MIQTQQQRTCDVCRILDYDCSAKLCFYCPMCDAWICLPDDKRWDRRLRAAIKRKLEPGYAGLQNYEEVAVQNKGELQ
jgi:hypothetical protein